MEGNDKPSVLLQRAFDALQHAENTPGMRALVEVWRDPKNMVSCLSRALAHKEMISPSKGASMKALEMFEVGAVERGLQDIGLELPEGMKPFYEVPEYRRHRAPFRAAVKRLVKILEREGL